MAFWLRPLNFCEIGCSFDCLIQAIALEVHGIEDAACVAESSELLSFWIAFLIEYRLSIGIGDFPINRTRPNDAAALGSFLGKPVVLLSGADAYPKRAVETAQHHLQLKQGGVTAGINVAGNHVAVVATAPATPVALPGVGASFHQLDQAIDELGLVVPLGAFGLGWSFLSSSRHRRNPRW